jgi:hypothetical protein
VFTIMRPEELPAKMRMVRAIERFDWFYSSERHAVSGVSNF